LMSWREALADVNGDGVDEGAEAADGAAAAVRGRAVSWREALADVNSDDASNEAVEDTAAAADADTVADAVGADVSMPRDVSGPSAAASEATITGAQVLAALAADGVDTTRWRARVVVPTNR